jgi:hypothetical protein
MHGAGCLDNLAEALLFPKPILDTHDSVVVRVAHHYRNPIYHQDRHNPTLIHPVGRLYAQAVGRAFIRSHRQGWAVSSPAVFMEEIARIGWQNSDPGLLDPRQAPTTAAAIKEIEHQQWTHVFGSERHVRTKIDLSLAALSDARANDSGGWRSSEARLLERYQQLDDELQLLEAAIDMMMVETDRRT